jgi:hypothetical protein
VQILFYYLFSLFSTWTEIFLLRYISWSTAQVTWTENCVYWIVSIYMQSVLFCVTQFPFKRWFCIGFRSKSSLHSLEQRNTQTKRIPLIMFSFRDVSLTHSLCGARTLRFITVFATGPYPGSTGSNLHSPRLSPEDPFIPSTPWSSKWSLSFWISHQNLIHIPDLYLSTKTR